MDRTIASLAFGILLATLVGACRPQYVAPEQELRAHTQSLRAHGVTVTAPADMREQEFSEINVGPQLSYYSWVGQRVWITIWFCDGVNDDGNCFMQGRERPREHVEDAELRRFESLDAQRPREVVWVTPNGGSARTVVFIRGRTLGDSALVRRISDSVRPMPD